MVVPTKKPKVSLITCTGGRPELFALCEKYVKWQTFKDIEWIVVDDTMPKTVCTMGQKYLRGLEEWTPGNNTQRVNMRLALQHVQGDYIFVWEDDDFYSPGYIAAMLSAFSHSQIVGISNARYYKTSMPGWAILDNYKHASLSQTAFHKDLLPLMKEAVESGWFFFDIELWKAAREKQIPLTLIANTSLSIGMKGLPGRPGLTRGHKDNKGFVLDPNHKMLEKWLGSYAKNYEPFLKKRVARKPLSS